MLELTNVTTWKQLLEIKKTWMTGENTSTDQQLNYLSFHVFKFTLVFYCFIVSGTATFRIRVIAPAIVTTPLPITPAGAPPQGLPFMIPIRPPVMDPPHHIRRRKKRLSFRPTTPPFPPAFLPDEWGSCYVGGEYKATIVTAYNVRTFSVVF